MTFKFTKNSANNLKNNEFIKFFITKQNTP